MTLVKGSMEKAFTYLESGPVIMVTTNDGERDNVMTITWHMVMDFSPRIAISTGPWNDSFDTIIDTGECCICVPGVEMIDKVLQVGTIHSSECADKFTEFGIGRQKAEYVAAPLIPECIGCLECKLEDYVVKHGLIILDTVALWTNPDREDLRTVHANGDGTFFVDGELLNLRTEMKDRMPWGSERF